MTTPSALELQLKGWSLTTAEIIYRMPDHRNLLQSYIWQEYDLAPRFPVLRRFLGFWDANPATLIPLSPTDSAPLYVEMMGGAARILARGRELFEAGDYLLAMEIANKLVLAEPANAEASSGCRRLPSGSATWMKPPLLSSETMPIMRMKRRSPSSTCT